MVAAFIILFASVSVTAADATIDAETNSYRQSRGLAPLVTVAYLNDIAAVRANEIVSNFAHPTNWDYMWNMMPSCVTWFGENLAWTTWERPGWPVQNWIASPAHHANMVSDFTAQGSAIVRVGDRTYAVQVFAKGCEGSAPAAPQTPVTAPAPPQVTQAAPTTQSTAPVTVLPDTAMPIEP